MKGQRTSTKQPVVLLQLAGCNLFGCLGVAESGEILLVHLRAGSAQTILLAMTIGCDANLDQKSKTCHKRAVPFDTKCAKVRLFNTCCECLSAG